MALYSELVNGQIVQTVNDGQPITTADGTKYPANFPKAEVPGLVQVVETAPPSATQAITSGYSVQLVSNVPTQVWNSQPIPLATAQQTAAAALTAAYTAAIFAPITFTSSNGQTKSYQADQQSLSNLQNMILAFQKSQATPPGFFWVAADNSQIPFTYADMQGLAEALGARGAAAFAKLQQLKSQLRAATTTAEAQAVAW